MLRQKLPGEFEAKATGSTSNQGDGVGVASRSIGRHESHREAHVGAATRLLGEETKGGARPSQRQRSRKQRGRHSLDSLMELLLLLLPVPPHCRGGFSRVLETLTIRVPYGF